MTDEEIVFAIAETDTTPVILLGVTERCWENLCGASKPSMVDFSRLGAPVRLIVFAAQTREEALATIEKMAQAHGATLFSKDRGST